MVGGVTGGMVGSDPLLGARVPGSGVGPESEGGSCGGLSLWSGGAAGRVK